MAKGLSTAQLAQALHWKRPDIRLVVESHREAFTARCDALLAYLNGKSIRVAAREHGVNRTTLTTDISKAFTLAPNGQLYGFRACLPWGVRQSSSIPAYTPTSGRPHALQALLKVHPDIKELLGTYKDPLPPGRLPPSFMRLLRKIRGLLAERNGQKCWPLNQADKGRRAFTRFVRGLREAALIAGVPDAMTLPQPQIKSLSHLFALQPYDRLEFDAHSKDIEFTLELPNARGELVKYKVSKVWILVLIEVNSTAVLGWKIVFGQGYSALDVSQCVASSMRPWSPRTLVAHDMAYVAGATMPQNLNLGCLTGCMTAMDNAKAHKAKLPLEAWVNNYDGILHLGYAHVPEVRATIEQFFNRLAQAALRLLPGGYIPTLRLGEKATPSSEWRSADHPVSFQALEDLLDVMMTGHNVTPLPSRQDRAPIDILLAYPRSVHFWPSPPHNEEDARALTTECRPVRLRGSRRQNKPVHVRFLGVDYRHPALDKKWDLLGSEYLALVDLEDLRTLTLVDDSLNEIAKLEAAPPWNIHRHDVTTRRRILKLSRSGELEIRGAYSAISAYAAYTLKSAQEGRANAVDQVARLMQLVSTGAINVTVTDSRMVERAPSPRETPLSGRVSFDDVKD
jgi:hypothetical protein